MKRQNHRQMMIISQSIIFVAFFVNYATCRTAKDYREMPGVPAAAVRQSQVQPFPSYNLDAPDGPGTYAFGYEIEDSQTGNIQFRDEEKLRNGTIKGSYGVVAPDDTVRLTRYIADHLGYRTTQEEARKRNDNGPLKLEVQVQPTVKHQQQQLTGEQAIAAVTSSPTFDPYQSRNPHFDPTSIYHQQTNINSHPSFYGQPAPNFPGDLFDPAALLYEQQLSYPYGLPPGLPNEYPPFEGGLLRQSNQPGPVIGFLSNLVQHNPFTTFFNQINPLTQQQQQQTTTQNTPILNLLSNLNPLNLLTNNNNNNNRPTVTIPAVTVTSPSLGSFGIQSDYVVTSPSPSHGQLVAIPSVPSHALSGNLDTSVFSYGNDHYNYPNYQQNGVNYGGQGGSFGNYQPSYLGFNQQYSTTNRPYQTYPNNAGNFYQPHSYFYGNRQIPAYQNPFQTGAITPLIGVNPYGYYGNRVKTSMTKNGGKKKHNKNKDESEGGSSWFENFLNQRKQTSLGDVTTSSTAVVKQRRPTKAKPAASDEDNDSSGLEDYFR